MTRLRRILLVLFGWIPVVAASAQTYVTPMLGGGQVFADMVHIDIYYDMDASQLHATVDDSYGTPVLLGLDPSLAFDPVKAYTVLNGKPYNSQYGWNVGGFFSLPPGSAIWIERVRSSSILETYSGYGSTGTYVPIFGTAGSSPLWKWSGVMVHNTYAVSNPPVSRVYADYHLFFGDALTGSRAGFMEYDDTTVRLEWAVEPVENPLTLKFGAVARTNGAQLSFVNGNGFAAPSGSLLNFGDSLRGDSAMPYEAVVSLMALAATALNGGPDSNSAATGSCLELELVSLTGPPGGMIGFYEAGESVARFQLATGESSGTNRIRLTENFGAPEGDPYGCYPGRSLALSEPGLYCLGFRAVDTSTNGPGASPVHAPSGLAYVNLQAGLTIASMTLVSGTIDAQFGGEPGKTFFLERRSKLGPGGTWETIAGPLAGTNRLQTLTDPAPTGSENWYRLRAQ